jgi:hypothetical protein
MAEPQHFDCSDVIARYILIASGLDFGQFAQEPHTIAPNNLTRLAELISQ